VRSIL